METKMAKNKKKTNNTTDTKHIGGDRKTAKPHPVNKSC